MTNQDFAVHEQVVKLTQRIEHFREFLQSMKSHDEKTLELIQGLNEDASALCALAKQQARELDELDSRHNDLARIVRAWFLVLRHKGLVTDEEVRTARTIWQIEDLTNELHEGN